MLTTNAGSKYQITLQTKDDEMKKILEEYQAELHETTGERRD